MRRNGTPVYTAPPKPPSAALAPDEGAGRELADAIERIRTDRQIIADKLAQAQRDARQYERAICGLDAALEILDRERTPA